VHPGGVKLSEQSFPANSEENVRVDAGSELLTGEIVEPREGSLDWLALQPHVQIDGLGQVPARHRLDLAGGGRIELGPKDGHCRYIRPDGRRCRSIATRRYELCIVHAGGGGTDMQAMARLGGQAKARMRIRRQLLGIGPKSSADPRSLLRLEAHARGDALVEAAFAPLRDASSTSSARHAAAMRILDATFPVEQVSVEVQLPADEAGVRALSWQDMQRLAAQLLAPHSDHTVPSEGA